MPAMPFHFILPLHCSFFRQGESCAAHLAADLCSQLRHLWQKEAKTFGARAFSVKMHVPAWMSFLQLLQCQEAVVLQAPPAERKFSLHLSQDVL